jgi:hypothetical protein
LGVIDTLTAGFNTVAKKLWLMIVPVILELYLWLGPKLSAAPVIAQTLQDIQRSLDGLAMPAETQMGAQQMIEMLNGIQQTVGRTNLFSLLAWGRLGMPSIMGTRPIEPQVDRVIELTSAGQLLGVQLLLLMAGLFIACFFLGMLGQEVRGEGVRLGTLIRRVPRYWLYLVVLFVPLAIVMVIAFTMTIFLGFMFLLAMALLLWILLYMYFVPEAITMGEASPLRAVFSSFTVVRMFFWPTVGLVLLINVLVFGMGMVWQAMMGSTVGTAAAILLNAYVGTSLVAASFIFYRDRVNMWIAALKQQQQRSA